MIISKKFHVVMLISLLFLNACGNDTAGNATNPAKNLAHNVETACACIQSVSNEIQVSGTIKAETSVRLYNEVAGRITKLPYSEGDFVNANTAVITLEDDLISAELEKAVALEKQATFDLNRLKKLVPKKLASEEELERARTQLDIAKSEVKLQRTKLAKATIRAPFDGVITERNNEPGDSVAMNSHILTLIDPKSLQITAYLSESWISQAKLNDDATINIDTLGEVSFKGSIKRIHPTINPQTRKGIIEFAFSEIPAAAKAGQLARVTLRTQPQDKIVIPDFAIQHDSTGAYVYVVDNDSIAHKTSIKKGTQFGNRIEIIDGLNLNDNVVVKGFSSLQHGKKVNIVSTATPHITTSQ